MTYYLYIKTHNQTGLKYLGKTQADPYTYKGSGIRWSNHLRTHGNDVTTEVLRECKTNDEIKYWGEYYSKLWNIVEARDENGNKIWANLKPESGDGGSYNHREDTKKLLSEIKSGKPAHNKGKPWSDDRKSRQAGTKSKENNPMFGKMFVNNGVTNLVINKTETIPLGYVVGAIQKKGNKKPHEVNPNKDKVWINNDNESLMISSIGEIPEGWVRGRLLNKMWITDGTNNAYIDTNDSVPAGWHRGRSKTK